MYSEVMLCHDHLFLNDKNDFVRIVTKLIMTNVCSSKTDNNTSKINDTMRKDRLLGIRIMTEMTSYIRNRQILHNHLNMTKVYSKTVPKNRLWFLANNRMSVLQHSPPPLTNSIDPCDFWLFEKLKCALKK